MKLKSNILFLMLILLLTVGQLVRASRISDFWGLITGMGSTLQPRNHVGIIPIHGDINVDSVGKIVRKIEKFSRDSHIKGVLLLIDSDGGNPGAGECVFREIKNLSQSKPVVVFVISTCCSAAYEIAVGADWIVTSALATVGSIGLFWITEKHSNPRFTNGNGYSADLSYEILYAGKFKIAAHPNAAPLNDEERAMFQEHVIEQYKILLGLIAQQRNLSLDAVNDWADGKQFNGYQALEKRLVDQVGGYSDALKKLKELMQQRDASSGKGELLFVM